MRRGPGAMLSIADSYFGRKLRLHNTGLATTMGDRGELVRLGKRSPWAIEYLDVN